MLFECFAENRNKRPTDPAFLIGAGDRSVPITWRQYVDDIALVVYVIRKYMPGATLGILGENSYEWMVAHAACMFSGATVVPVDMNLSPEEIAGRLTFTGTKALIHSALYKEKARAVRRLCPGLLTAGFGTVSTDLFLMRERAALRSSGEDFFAGPPPDVNRTSMIVFTSGTTSSPRGAELSIKGIETFASFAQEQLKMKPLDRSLMLLPLHHIFGVCVTYLMLANGVSLGVCPDFRRLYDAVERFRAKYLFLVPALAELLSAKISQHGRSAEEAFGAPIDWVLLGGAPTSIRTWEHLQELGIRPLTGYGLTETTALYSITPVEGGRCGSAGKVCNGRFGMETKVDDDGHILLRGPSVLKQYFLEPERTAESFRGDGWYDTGDLGRIDEEGWLWITGRASRTIILSSGKKIAPEELEAKIEAIPGIREVVVSGEEVTRRIKAEIYAVVNEDTVRRQINALNAGLPIYKRIALVVVRTEPFPRTASGKIKV